MAEQLMVYKFNVVRDYKDQSSNYMIFESGSFAHPLIVLTELEAERLRDKLDAAIKMKGSSNG